MIPALIAGVGSLLTNIVTGFQKKQEAKQAMELAALENKARLLADTESNNHAWEMANITDSDRWLRRMSFLMFSSPFLVAIIAPNQVFVYFTHAISAVPLWWQETYMAITGAVWGLSALKNSVVGLAGELKNQAKND